MKTISHQINRERHDEPDEFLNHRRLAAALTLVGMASLGVVALYQLGMIKHLPEPPLARLDAEKVNGSAEACKILDTPDAMLGLASYAVTLGLVRTGGADRAETRPLIPLALAAKAGADAVQAAVMTRKSWVHFRAFSFYSLITVAATLLTLPAVLPEARAALRKLRGGRRKGEAKGFI